MRSSAPSAKFVPSHGKGWDQPVSGAPAAALAAGRLLGLDKAQLRHALALSVIPNIATMQTRTGELSMWKGVAGPNAARQGIFAALLAQAGMTGPQDCYEGKFGLWQQTMGQSYKFPIPRSLAKHQFALIRTNIKIYPVRDAIQVPITAALKLREKLRPEEIEAVRIVTYAKHFAVPTKDPALWAPTTRETADHSLPFCVAAALIDGQVTPETFARGRFRDKDTQALIKRMNVEFDDGFEKARTGDAELPHRRNPEERRDRCPRSTVRRQRTFNAARATPISKRNSIPSRRVRWSATPATKCSTCFGVSTSCNGSIAS